MPDAVGQTYQNTGRTIKRASLIQRALEKAGVIFIDSDDGGPGARLCKG
jgi:hypothetical protein